MKKNQLILIITLVVWGILSRTVLHIAPNIEFITAISLAAGLFISDKRLVLVVPFAAMFLSDLIIGNTSIFIFTWSGFLIPALVGMLSAKKIQSIEHNKVLKIGIFAELVGIASTLFFFLWTNFGHWLTTQMYSRDLSGLIDSYIYALPFLKPQLAGNLIIVPILVLTVLFAINFATQLAGGKQKLKVN